MFKAVLSDSNILKTSFDAISSIVDEVQMQADEEGLRLDALAVSYTHLDVYKRQGRNLVGWCNKHSHNY